MARPIPSMNPVVVVSGVLNSPWASNQTMPKSHAPAPESVPTAAMLQLPESTSGNSPSPRALRTWFETSPCSSKAVATSAVGSLVAHGSYVRLAPPRPQPFAEPVVQEVLRSRAHPQACVSRVVRHGDDADVLVIFHAGLQFSTERLVCTANIGRPAAPG